MTPQNPLADRLARSFSRLLFGPQAGEWMAPVLRRFLGGLGLVLALSLAVATLGLATPYLTKLIIDEGLLAKDGGALVLWAGLAFAVGLAAVGGGALSGLVHLRFSARMLAEVRGRVLDAVLRQGPRRGQVGSAPIGEVMTRLDGDAGEVQQFAFDALLSGLGAVLRLSGGAVMLAVLEWRLALVAIALTPLELVFLAWARPRTERMAARVRERRGVLSSFLAESVAGLGVIRALGAEGARRTALDAPQEAQVDALMAQRRWREVTTAVPSILGALARTATLLLGGWWVIQGQWPLGSLVAFLGYLGFLTGPLRTLLGLYHAQARVKVAVARILDLLGEGESGGEKAGQSRPREPVPSGPGVLALEGVGFAHGPTLDPVVEDLSLTLPAGRKILLKGESGRGKTTLIGLLTGGLLPDRGRVTLEGVDIARLDSQALRRAVVVVPQVGWVFQGTIADNLRLAAPDATEADLWRVLDLVGLGDWLKRDRQGLDTEARERGLDLSGGQRQRLALARALLVPFRVLILDESLSEVDGDSAAAIVAAIDGAYPERTRILVAHAGAERLGPFDQVVDLDRNAFRRTDRGEVPNQRVKARVKAV
ncbi:ABC transporter ATP-binding protein [Rhodospirillum sp. A1_3_36]|uniref:ABC transporter ATP-binding protein n=1 Tax=Rhodospirillum sp. A1_3_36 TaxID=3391666 RepID=UPI0039A5EA22